MPTCLWFERALLTDGWRDAVRLTVADGRIAAIATGVPPRADDVRGGPAIAGLPNLHSHAFQRGMAGLAEQAGDGPDSFWTWREAMYRFVDRLDPDMLRTIAALAYVEMLESGFTRVGEFHYLHHAPSGAPYADPAAMGQAIATAAGETGIALTLLPVFYAHADFGGAPPQPAQRRFVSDLDGYARLIEASRAAVGGLDGAVVGIAPHSLRAVTQAELDALATVAPTGPIHIHIAEQQREVDACLAWSGQRPVDWLLSHADVDERWCLVHATHIDDTERTTLIASRAVIGLCPITEANLGDGLFPARAFHAGGGVFGIGSDSNVLIDAAEELRLLEYGQRLTHRARNVMASADRRSTGASLWDAARRGGAQALGASATGLAVGAPADIVSFAVDHPASVGRPGDLLLDSWIFGGARDAIDGVWRGGAQLVAAGRHRARDTVQADYVALMTRLQASP